MSTLRCLALAVMLLQAASFADSQNVRPPEEAACGSSDSKLRVHTDRKQHPLGAAGAGEALIYIIEEQPVVKSITFAHVTRYGIDGTWIGGNQGNSYFFRTIGAGEHHLCGESQLKYAGLIHAQGPLSMISLTAKDGASYYFRALVDVNLGRLDLQPVSADEGKLLISRSAFSTTKPF
jgi:hypothetical protein